MANKQTAYNPAEDTVYTCVDRLSALEKYNILSSRNIDSLTRLCATAALTLQVPHVIITLVDHQRGWTIAGSDQIIGPAELPGSFAACVVKSGQTTVIEDAQNDAGFARLTMVVRDKVQSFMGAPIKSDGQCLGSLTAFDYKPRRFPEGAAEVLENFAGIVIDQMNLHRMQVNHARKIELGQRQAAKLKQQHQDLWRKDQMFQQVSRLTSVGGWELDLDKNELFWSDEVYRIHELPAGQTPDPEKALTFVEDDAREKIRETLQTAIVNGEPFDVELPLITASGRRRWVRTVSQTEKSGNRVTRLLGAMQDITVQKRREREIEHRSMIDDLTGLNNRRGYATRAETAYRDAVERRSLAGLMMIDLDHFKEVNDTYGHEAGDQVLAEFARRLQTCIRPDDIACRLGGDEFAVFFPDITSDQVLKQVAGRLLDAVARPMTHSGGSSQIGASIGIAMYPRDADTLHGLSCKADSALYKSKKSGRGRHEFAA